MKHLLRPLSFTSFFVFCALLLTGSASLFTGSAIAQGPPPPPPSWTPLMPPPNPFKNDGDIHIVKFLDAVGKPLTGFVSDGPQIYRTTAADGGISSADWTKVTITGNNPLGSFQTGWVNDISFRDSQHGAAVIQGNTSPIDAGVLLTADGGATWTFDDVSGTPDSGSGIYYNPTTGWLFVSGLDKGLVYSTNDGTSWNVIDTNTYYTGFAFTDANRGVVATMGSNPSGFAPVNYWRYTTDGGQTWPFSRMYYESWQPVGIPGTETFFASSAQYINSTPMIFRSDNNGYNFLPAPFNALPTDNLTEAMQGDGCSLFAASTTSVAGMWVSISDGLSWNTLLPTGSPTPDIKTRFYVSPTTVWSFQTNQLQWIPRVATPSIHLWPDSIAFTNAGCSATSDTTIHLFGCDCANNTKLLSATVTQTIATDNLTVTTPTLPDPLCSSTTAPEGSPQSIGIAFQPTGANPNADAGTIALQFSDNGTIVNDTIKVTSNAISPSANIRVPLHRVTLSGPACSAGLDTCFEIDNTSCSCITIAKVNLFELPTDTCSLKLCTSVPFTLQPGQSQCFEVCFVPGIAKNIAAANISFTWETCDGSINGTTQEFEVDGVTTTTDTPSFRGFTLGLPPDHARNCCDIPLDTFIYFVNTTCEPIILNTPNFFDHNGCVTFLLDSLDPLYRLHFPDTIYPGPGGHLTMHVKLANCCVGTSTQKVGFTYAIGTSTDCSSIPSGGDTMTLTVKSTGDLTLPTIKPILLSFANTSCCDSSQTRTATLTSGCKPDTLTASSLTFDPTKGKFFIVSPLTTPMILSPGQTVSIQVGYLPICDSTVTGNLSLTLSDGTELNVQINGSTSNVAEAALSMNQVNFDTLPCGTSKCDTVWIKNASCGPIKIGAIIPPGPANPAFTLTPPAAGTTLNRGDSLPMLVCLNPAVNNSSGSLTDMAILAIDNTTGTPASFDSVSLLAYVVPPAPAFTLTQLTDTTICDTSTLDETFTFTNTGTCYTYVFTSANTRNSEVTIAPQTARVPVGSSQTFTVHFAPGGVPGNLVDSIMLVDSAGNSIEVPYDITVVSCASKGGLTVVMPGSTIITPNCTDGDLVFTVGAGGGAGTVTSVTVTNSPRFTATNTTGGPMPFTDTVIFDPNQLGGNTSTLTINYTINGVSGDTTILITGDVTGTKYSASIGVTSPTSGCISPNDTDLKEFDIMLYDSIPDALGMNQLSFVLHYNGDLLWDPKNANFGPGWNIVSETQESDGLHVTLSYTGTGNGAAAAGTAVVKIQELGALTKILSDTAHVTNPHFNDSAFEACVLKAFAASGGDSNSVPICIDTNSCAQGTILKALQGTLSAVTGIEVIPDPAHKDGSAATLHFTSNVSAPMTVDVVNVLGNSVAQLMNGPVEKGDHAIDIPTNNMAEGAYFVRISVNGYTVVRKFVLEKE